MPSSDSRKRGIGRPRQSRAWRVNGNHVYPIDDFREHSPADCWCRPTDDDGVIVHHSLDGREFYERGERRLS